MTSRFTRGFFIIIAAATPLVAQERRAADLKRSIDSLSAFDYATRMNAARVVRRVAPADVVPALAQAVRGHSDQFVRYRALVLLTAFNDRATPDLMRSLLTDRNDRVREIAYRWFERHPDPGLTDTLLAALNTEQAEFVRPALIGALAALPSDERVRRALTTEAGRGLDFFRSAVIEALGEYRAAYAVDAIAAVAQVEGPLQDEAILALGRIGAGRARLPDIGVRGPDDPPDPFEIAIRAAWCLLDRSQGVECSAHTEHIGRVLANPKAADDHIRMASRALSAIAADGGEGALGWLVGVEAASRTAGAAVAIAMSAAALRNPPVFIGWLTRDFVDMRDREVAKGAAITRERAISLLSEGFQRLEEDYAEERFFAALRGAYWAAAEGSTTRTMIATLINKLEF